MAVLSSSLSRKSLTFETVGRVNVLKGIIRLSTGGWVVPSYLSQIGKGVLLDFLLKVADEDRYRGEKSLFSFSWEKGMGGL